jgi:hypothetical protein
MTGIRQRAPRQEDRAHLAFIRTRKCCIRYCNRPAEAAHIRMACLAIGKEYTGKSEKPDDKWTVPLCPYHHRIGIDCQHSMSEEEFWRLKGVNPFGIAAELWKASGGEERAATPKPVRQPRKIKARRPRDKRKKIPVGRPMKSNPVIQSRGFPKRYEHRTTS